MLRVVSKSAIAASLALSLAGCVSSGDLLGLSGVTGRVADYAALGSSGHIAASAMGTTIPAPLLEQRMQNMGVAARTRGVSVPYKGSEEPGTVVIEQSRHSLYLVEEGGKATRYTVAIGAKQNQWQGTAKVSAVHLQPGWTTPQSMVRSGQSAALIPSGAPNNPMGIGALTLTGGDYAIHGTNRPDTIGRAVSGGCFRMHNEDIADLMRRVRVGTSVIVRS